MTNLIKELRELLQAATPGPWNQYEGLFHKKSEQDLDLTTDSPDAQLIVAMRNSLPELLTRMEKLEAVAEAARRVYPTDMRAPQLIEALAALDKEDV